MSAEVTVADMTAAPIELEGVDGKMYYLSPLTLGDMGELERWVLGQPLRRAQRMIQEFPDMPDDGKELFWKTAISDVNETRSLHDPIAVAFMETMESTLYTAWLCFRHRHPEMLLANVAEVTPLGSLPVILAKIMEATKAAVIMEEEEEGNGEKTEGGC